jgi:SAM-dependent methyltransferase
MTCAPASGPVDRPRKRIAVTLASTPIAGKGQDIAMEGEAHPLVSRGRTVLDCAEVEVGLREIARTYPPSLIERELVDVKRIAFHVTEVGRRMGSDIELVDVGGGIGLFTLGCARCGMRATLIDDFLDPVVACVGPSVLDVHRRAGVRVVARDAVRDGLGLRPSSVDVVTCFDSMEHWHNSPKRLFAEIMATLKPGGLFFLSGPNCVNARKRLTVPFGYGKWTAMEEWYEERVFRGHTREPDVEDLLYIARDMGLHRVEVFGRNWLGYANRSRTVRAATPFLDRVLRWVPQLCSDIYLAGYRSQ